jgi:hypothetical protein
MKRHVVRLVVVFTAIAGAWLALGAPIMFGT